VNGINSTVNLNEVIIKCSSVSKQSQIIVVNDDENQNEFDGDDEDNDSAETHLLRDDCVKVHNPPNRTSTDTGSAIRETQASMSDLRTTVSSPSSRTSSSEGGTRTNEEASMSKYTANTGGPNM
jgi:hypothetical protein